MFQGSDANDYVKSSPPKITMAVIKTWLSVWPRGKSLYIWYKGIFSKSLHF